jgi:hypothetical protein
MQPEGEISQQRLYQSKAADHSLDSQVAKIVSEAGMVWFLCSTPRIGSCASHFALVQSVLIQCCCHQLLLSALSALIPTINHQKAGPADLKAWLESKAYNQSCKEVWASVLVWTTSHRVILSESGKRKCDAT